MQQQINTITNIKSSVTGCTKSQKFVRRDYGSMNAAVRILSVLKQANGAMCEDEIARCTGVLVDTVGRQLRRFKNEGVLDTFTDEKTNIKYWTQKV